MQPRLFSKKQKMAVELVTGQTGEADHVVPYSKGGKTDVENLQLISGRINRMKGAFKFEPRNWQVEFLEKWQNRQESRPFMLIAIPGSGKTMAALEAARRWTLAGADRRIIVVVPSDNLRKQWQDEACNFGLQLQTKEFGTNFKHGYTGAVVTYHLVANNPLLFRKLCSVAPTMVIFDEIHHCGDESHFGEGIKEAFENSAEKLLMSGTPWKSDGKPIPFVRYDGDGFALGDQRYDYPDALTDGVVRYLVFNHSKGSIINIQSGEIGEVNGEIAESEAARRLSVLLNADGEYVEQQIIDSHRKLMELRNTVPNAAALAICIDQYHAARVAALIKKITGCEPSLIVSDSELENDNVKSFRESSKEWLVSVRKVSEGTDIKRLMVLCYMTNVTAELFFRQAIGRISRIMEEIENSEGYVFLPADPRLIAAAKNIENAQVLAIQDEIDKTKREIAERNQQEKPQGVYATSHDGIDTVLVGNESVSIAEHQHIEHLSKVTGVSQAKILQLKRLMGASPVPSQPTACTNSNSTTVSKEENDDRLRSKCNTKAFCLSKKLGIDVKEIHRRFKPQQSMTTEELQSKLNWLLQEIAKS